MSNSGSTRTSGLAVLLALVLIAAVVAAIYPLPSVLLSVAHEDWETVPLTRQIAQEGQVRAHLLQGVGAILLIVGAVTALRQLRVSQRQLHADQASKNVEAFTHAIDLLSGSTAASRIAGVTALRSLAESDGIGRRPVIDILSSYVRDSRAPEDRQACEFAVRAVSALRDPIDSINFSGAQLLNAASLTQLKLTEANFSGCDLRDTDFSNSDLRGCSFSSADMSRATLYGSDLGGADIETARMIDVRKNADTKLG